MLRRTRTASWMARRTPPLLAAARARGAVTPLDLFMQVQAGATQNPHQMRSFIQQHFREETEAKGITDNKLANMDTRKVMALLRQLFFDKYLSVEFSLFTYDLEFTSVPKFTKSGPTEDIVEVGVYSPDTDASFSSLVKPLNGRPMAEEAAALTKLTTEEVNAAPDFATVWKGAKDFMAREGAKSHKARQAAMQTRAFDAMTPMTTSEQEPILLLSHGGKLADQSMLGYACEQIGDPFLKADHNTRVVFGDTDHHVRDLHRRRPVTKDKLPPSWKLEDLGQWLDVPVPEGVHRAGADARLTWDVLYHTMDRYGDDQLLPRQQLVQRFFDEQGKAVVAGMVQHADRNTGSSHAEQEAMGRDALASAEADHAKAA